MRHLLITRAPMQAMTGSSLLLGLLVAAGAGPAFAQSDAWHLYEKSDGVEVYYAVRISRDEARVSWKCVNANSTNRSCSVGAGREKIYRCTRDGAPLGLTNSLGESATVRASGEYVFPSDFACRGLGATAVEPYGVRIHIER